MVKRKAMERALVSLGDLFRQALGDEADPFPWQQRLAEADLTRRVIRIPTGAGKTAGIILGWLYRRRFHPSGQVRQSTPRRLVYCLPMRVLVEQTYTNAIRWLERLGMLAGTVETANGDGRSGRIRYWPRPELDELPDGWA
ncbi:MAG: DEAD/DEAH box helicase, partial [Moorella sp. (in: Bacteria)]|nr:DEAD/DEAH box helicase [Moorella sp. (in: firmicutes)]